MNGGAVARFRERSDDRISLDAKTGPQDQQQLVASPAVFDEESSTRSTDTSMTHVLVEWPVDNGPVTIAPLNTLPGHERFFQSKYEQILRITIEQAHLPEHEIFDDGSRSMRAEDFLEGLPPGFVKDPQYGLGLLKDCNRFVHLVEEHTDCAELSFETGNGMEKDGSVFRIGLSTWGDIWAEIQRINARGNTAAARVKDSFVNNELAETLGIAKTTPGLGRLPMSKLLAMAANGDDAFTEVEQRELVEAMQSQARSVIEVTPETVVALQRNLELVSLDRLIDLFEKNLNKSRPEAYWQDFFEFNNFALQQVFGTPIVSVQSGASVGGMKLDGSGTKIADYLMQNALTMNIALVEIKTPQAEILRKQPYRAGVYGISPEVSEAVTQVLDQAHQLKLNFNTVKSNSREYEMEAYSIGCYVIVGKLPEPHEHDRLKSFELFRGSLSNVNIITFDEVLANLKLLRDLLTADPVDASPSSSTS